LTDSLPIDEILKLFPVFGTSPALRCEEHEVSYMSLYEQICELRSMFAELSVPAGSRVAFLAGDQESFVCLLLSLAASDCISLPLSEMLAPVEFADLCRQMKPDYVFLPARNSKLTDSLESIFFSEDLSDPLADYQLIRLKSDGSVRPPLKGGFVRFTSGTTGKSKGVYISCESALERVEAATLAFPVSQGERVLFCMPLPYHFVVSLLFFLKQGAELIFPPLAIHSSPGQLLIQHKASVMYAAPFHYNQACEAFSAPVQSDLRLAISTSTNLPTSVAKSFQKIFQITLTQVYGLIEVGLPLALKNPAPEELQSLGIPMPGYEAALFLDGNLVQEQEGSGILAVRGAGIFDAYLEPFRTRDEVLHDGWFLTGDIATRNSKGVYSILGRASSVIHVAGHKVFPEEVEDVILSNPRIKAARVFGEPHHLLQNVIVAEVCPVAGELISDRELRKYCKSRLSRYKVPQEIRLKESLPETATGKIIRN